MNNIPLTQRNNNFVSLQQGVHAVVQKPVQHLENVFGQAPSDELRRRNGIDFEQLGEYKTKPHDRGFVGQLPYQTSPRLYGEGSNQRLIPEETRVSKVCFNTALEESGPWYARHWQIWDYAPVLPSIGDVTKDPRYGQQTKGFTTEYKKML